MSRSGWQKKNPDGNGAAYNGPQLFDLVRLEKAAKRLRNMGRRETLDYIEAQEAELARLMQSYASDPAGDTLRSAREVVGNLYAAFTAAVASLPPERPTPGVPMPPGLGRARVG
jgi:hypothetical protein